MGERGWGLMMDSYERARELSLRSFTENSILGFTLSMPMLLAKRASAPRARLRYCLDQSATALTARASAWPFITDGVRP